MALDAADSSTIDAWVASEAQAGRVVTRIPGTVSIPDPITAGTANVPAGQLGSRLAVADPTLGAGPLQWDYEVAPADVRVIDNLSDASDEVATAMMEYSSFITDYLTQVAQVPGDVAQGLVADAVAPFVAAFLPTWAWWLIGGVAAFGLYKLATDAHTRGRAAHYAKLGAASVGF